jgi:hypothetical protein
MSFDPDVQDLFYLASPTSGCGRKRQFKKIPRVTAMGNKRKYTANSCGGDCGPVSIYCTATNI